MTSISQKKEATYNYRRLKQCAKIELPVTLYVLYKCEKKEKARRNEIFVNGEYIVKTS